MENFLRRKGFSDVSIAQIMQLLSVPTIKGTKITKASLQALKAQVARLASPDAPPKLEKKVPEAKPLLEILEETWAKEVPKKGIRSLHMESASMTSVAQDTRGILRALLRFHHLSEEEKKHARAGIASLERVNSQFCVRSVKELLAKANLTEEQVKALQKSMRRDWIAIEAEHGPTKRSMPADFLGVGARSYVSAPDSKLCKGDTVAESRADQAKDASSAATAVVKPAAGADEGT